MDRTLVVGAVAYDARVVPIWEGMRDYFREVGPPIDYVLFSNYEGQVEALLDRHIDIAWNTNLAWVRVHRRTSGACRALAMRDVDVDFTTVFVARAAGGVHSLADVRGKRLALGSADSAQAAILPIHYLQQAGVNPDKDCRILRFNTDVGKHGDTGTSELDSLRALLDDRADVTGLGHTTWLKQVSEGRVELNQIRPIWTSPGYCHCNFTVLADLPEELGRRWTASLLAMRHENPRWRSLMDAEGVKRWVAADPAILEGYRVLFDAVERQEIAR
jgi:phosphonate transport system substrate-binding protein